MSKSNHSEAPKGFIEIFTSPTDVPNPPEKLTRLENLTITLHWELSFGEKIGQLFAIEEIEKKIRAKF